MSESASDDALQSRITELNARLEAVTRRLDRERAKRRQVEKRLSAAESHYRRLIDRTPGGVACIGRDYRFLRANPAFCAMLGYTEQELQSLTFIEVTHPEDIPRDAHIVARQFDDTNVPVRQERRYLTKQGDILWAQVTDLIVRDPDETPLYRMNLVENISLLKHEAHAREQVQRRLTTIEQEQRRRIARELHDQAGQQLAALRMAVESWMPRHADDAPPSDRLSHIQNLTDFLMDDVHHFTRALRDTGLEQDGLDAALHRYVEEWTDHYGIPVDYQSAGFDDGRFASDVERQLFRIVQEALTNVHRHADAQRVSVVLQRHDGHVQVIVEDDGRGFDVETAMQEGVQGRLGLRGMRERAEMIGGTITVESSPGAGTAVVVRVGAG